MCILQGYKQSPILTAGCPLPVVGIPHPPLEADKWVT